MKQVIVTGSFDNLRSPEMRFLDEASRLGTLTVLLWSDELVSRQTGKAPKFPEAERKYFLEAARYVDRVERIEDALPVGGAENIWAVREADDIPAWRDWSAAQGLEFRVIPDAKLAGFPRWDPLEPLPATGRRTALVTGCYDWLHSGHVRFFEEVSGLGDLIVVVGNDANVRNLKGEGHPLYPEEERRYMVASIRYVTRALVTTGWGWLDAEPEIERLKPDMYAVNEDGDKPEKRAYCAEHGLEYVILKRTPKEGLPRRESTHLRGF
jgi:cytidyltransferase-like protein